MTEKAKVAVIGGGLAGSEAAWQLVRFGHRVDLFEMRPTKSSPAHQTNDLGELVCSNSFGSEGTDSAQGLLKEEMKALDSIVLSAAELARVPAGRALGVDRKKFAAEITTKIESEPRIRVIREECSEIPPYDVVIIATGPLTSEPLVASLQKKLGGETLYFYDSISPIVLADSIDYSKTYFGSRYEPDQDDYLNCPMDRVTYEKFVEAILTAEKVPVRDFEVMKCFEACLPIEVLAERGLETLAFGPMRPVGLDDPRTGRRPYAVVQLRRENQPTTMYNLVGFQTRMKWGPQKEVLRMIPGLEQAEFVRMGSMHRNTYIESPKLLTDNLSLKTDENVLFAGQITGVEGYVESAAMGQWAGLVAAARLRSIPLLNAPPPDTAMGALIRSITVTPEHGHFAPMNMNFGLLPHDVDFKGPKEARRARMLATGRKKAEEWRKTLEERLGAVWMVEESTSKYAQPRF